MDQFGTDEDSLLTQFESLRTKDDLLYLIKTFGVRKYWLGTHSFLLGEDLNLMGWLQSELSSSYMDQIKSIFEQLDVNVL